MLLSSHSHFSARLGAVSTPRPAVTPGAVRDGGRGWPQATAGGGAQRPRRALRMAPCSTSPVYLALLNLKWRLMVGSRLSALEHAR